MPSLVYSMESKCLQCEMLNDMSSKLLCSLCCAFYCYTSSVNHPLRIKMKASHHLMNQLV